MCIRTDHQGSLSPPQIFFILCQYATKYTQSKVVVSEATHRVLGRPFETWIGLPLVTILWDSEARKSGRKEDITLQLRSTKLLMIWAGHVTAPAWPRRLNSVSVGSAIWREPAYPTHPIHLLQRNQSVLTRYITVWYGNCNNSDRKSLQRIVKSAESIIRCYLSMTFTLNTAQTGHPGS